MTVPAGQTVQVPVNFELPATTPTGLDVLQMRMDVYGFGRPSEHSRVPGFLQIDMVFGSSPGA